MKKIVLIGLLTTGLMAGSNQDYFGISAGNAKMTSKASAAGVAITGETDDTHYSATLGHYYDQGRVYATFTYVDPTTYVDTASAIAIGYDFILPVVKDSFSLYAGPVAGYLWYKESAGSLSLNLSGFNYGAQAGGIINITKNLDLDAGYRYLIETGKDTVSGVNIEAQKVTMWYAGINVRF